MAYSAIKLSRNKVGLRYKKALKLDNIHQNISFKLFLNDFGFGEKLFFVEITRGGLLFPVLVLVRPDGT